MSSTSYPVYPPSSASARGRTNSDLAYTMPSASSGAQSHGMPEPGHMQDYSQDSVGYAGPTRSGDPGYPSAPPQQYLYQYGPGPSDGSSSSTMQTGPHPQPVYAQQVQYQQITYTQNNVTQPYPTHPAQSALPLGQSLPTPPSQVPNYLTRVDIPVYQSKEGYRPFGNATYVQGAGQGVASQQQIYRGYQQSQQNQTGLNVLQAPRTSGPGFPEADRNEWKHEDPSAMGAGPGAAGPSMYGAATTGLGARSAGTSRVPEEFDNDIDSHDSRLPVEPYPQMQQQPPLPQLHLHAHTQQTKKVRTQFSACQSCRIRRVKCDLKDAQEEWDSLFPHLDPSRYRDDVTAGEDSRGLASGGEPNSSDARYGPSLAPGVEPGQSGAPLIDPVTGESYRPRGVLPTGKNRPGKKARKTRDIRGLKRDEVACTNCHNRATTCVDEYGDRRERRKGVISGSLVGGTTSQDLVGGQETDGQTTSGVERVKQDLGKMNRYDPLGGSHGHGLSRHHTAFPMQSSAPADSAYRSGEQPVGEGVPALGVKNPNPRVSLSATALHMPLVEQPRTSTSHAVGETASHDGITMAYPSHTFAAAPTNLTMPSYQYEVQAAALSHHNNLGQHPRPYPPPLIHTASRELNQPVPSQRPPLTLRHSSTFSRVNKLSTPPLGPVQVQAIDQGDGEIPDLTADFLSSAFYRRFHIQRPICDPADFSRRYLAQDPPKASSMGKEGAILVHIMYAWACSYGVDQSGCLDVPERNWPGGILPAEAGYVWSHDQARDRDRLKRRAKTDGVVAKILKEIDDAGIMRRHSWDGVRCLLLILPLTEYVSTPMERLAMYECAVAQVFALCSLSSLGYDGLQHNLGPEGDIIRVRLYWYTFVHEGITSGLKGGRLVLDEDDLENFQASLPQGWAVVTRSSAVKSMAKLATAPIRLAVACRLIHKALTGPKARRQERVNKKLMNDAWEALECCWEEFESLRHDAPANNFLQQDDIIRFADGWRIFMFEAHNVIRESLEHRCVHLVPRPEGAFLTELSLSAEETDPRVQMHNEIQHLHDIARAKCEQLTRRIVDIVKMHINTSFFEWDASLVRDGAFYAAMLLAKDHGSEEDVAACLQALNEMRWAYAKTGERSNKLRDLWAERQAKMAFPSYSTPFGTASNSATPPSSSMLPPAHSLMTAISSLGANISGWMPDGMLADTASISQSNQTDIVGDIADSAGAGAFPSTAAVPPSLEHSPVSATGSSPPILPRAESVSAQMWTVPPGSGSYPHLAQPIQHKGGIFETYPPMEAQGARGFQANDLSYLPPSRGIQMNVAEPRDLTGEEGGARLVYPEQMMSNGGGTGWR